MSSASDLFAGSGLAPEQRPLADRMRPTMLDQVAGQRHLLAPGKPLRTAIESGRPYSMILWGPPGTGKTTLAKLIAHYCDATFLQLSAVLAGVKDIRAAVDRAQLERAQHGRATVLFIDEVHRFNKAQQDAFLPFVEDGTLVFIGATTENPSFELNNALLSRARTHVLKTLERDDIEALLARALGDSVAGLGTLGLELEAGALAQIAAAADGDARRALTFLEIAVELAEPAGEGLRIGAETLAEVISGGVRRFDKGGDQFYDQISALHKSVRGSAPNAALYWLARILDGGCDPLYIARRVTRMASEDIGNADPRALQLALAAWDVQERLGSPEGELALGQVVLYLACAPKSNAAYTAFAAAQADARAYGSLEVPAHLRNAPTRLMKELGHGEGYRYAHDEADGYAAGERYLPDGMADARYYRPSGRGLEERIARRLAELRDRDRAARRKGG